MKSKLAFMAGAVTLGAAAWMASQVWGQYPPQGQPAARPPVAVQPTAYQQVPAAAPVAAQPQPYTQAPLRTRIATVNFISVIKNYRKCQACEAQIKSEMEAADKQFEGKRQQLLNMKQMYDNPQTQVAQKEQLEKDSKRLQMEMQEMGEDFKKRFDKQRGEMAVALYREIEDAVTAYARANDIELVVHYNDATTPAELYHPANIQRKMQGAGCTPIYKAPGMDISDAVVQMLNQKYAPATSAVPGVRPPGS